MNRGFHSVLITVVLLLTITVLSKWFTDELTLTSLYNNKEQQEPKSHASLVKEIQAYLTSIGLPFESDHLIYTNDGYVLNLFRIPPISPTPDNQNMPTNISSSFSSVVHALTHRNTTTQPKVVLLQHGILDSAWCFIDNYIPSLSVAVYLHQHNYDVWIGNSRGTLFSPPELTLNHPFWRWLGKNVKGVMHKWTFFNPHPQNEKEYWDFSFDEMGRYDLPKTVEYIKQATGADKINYVCHSQGCTAYLVNLSPLIAGSEHCAPPPESLTKNTHMLANDIQIAVLLAPVARLDHTHNAFLRVGAELHIADVLRKALDVNAIFKNDEETQKAIRIFCKLNQQLCDSLYRGFGSTVPADDPKSMEISLTHFPSSTSLENVEHFQQMMLKERFQMYDYGRIKNARVYRCKKPPVYDIANLSSASKFVIFSGDKDDVADPRDVDFLINTLPKQTIMAHKRYPDFGHLTYKLASKTYASWLEDLLEALQEKHCQPIGHFNPIQK